MFVQLFATILFLTSAICVDRSNFKTCDQSSFCKRNRAVHPGQSSYDLQMNSLKINPTNIEGHIINKQNGITFKMQLFALVDNTVRLKINELEPMYPRFEAKEALVGEPKEQQLTVQSQDANSVTLTFGINKIVVTAKPLQVNMYTNDQLVISTNSRGLMKFEHYRPKPEPKPEGEEAGQDNDEENESGMWEETFKSHTDSKPRGPSSVGLDFSFPGFEAIYGIPEHADLLALRSTNGIDPYRLFNLDVFEYEVDTNMALYVSVPFAVAHSKTNTVGMLWLNAAETWVDVDYISEQQNVMLSLVDFVKGQTKIAQVDTHWFSESGIIDVFFVLGPKPADVFRQYSELTGATQLPPLFSLAYHHCRWNFNDEEDVRNVDSGFDDYDIPYDVIWLDIEYTDGKKYFTWDKMKFPHPSDMVANLTAKGRKLVTIIDPHIKRTSGYFVHEECMAKGYYVKNKDGQEYEGWCWPGSSSWPDFFNPEVREYWGSKFAYDQFEGSSPSVFIWNDMNEPSVFSGPEVTMPKDNKFYGDFEHRDVHNMYGMMFQMSTFNGLVKRSGGKHRPFLLSRAGFAGSQRYGAFWTGDNTADWSHLRYTTPMLLSMSLAGITFIGSDVGGFFKNPSSELLTRYYQAGGFHPFFRAHAHLETKRREPWLFEEDVRLIIRDAIRRRYALLPYWYTLFYENEKTGMPVLRPMWVEFPTDSKTFRMDEQFMLGNALLIRPVVESGATKVDVYFPESENIWYDAEEYDKFDASGFNSIPVTLSKIPYYQKSGTIIPRRNRIRRASTLGQDDPYSLTIALDKTGSFANGTLYIDDGFSYDYREGAFIYLSLTYINGQLQSRNLNLKKTFRTRAWIERLVILGLQSKPQRVELESKGNKKLEFSYMDEKQALVVRKPVLNIGEDWVLKIR